MISLKLSLGLILTALITSEIKAEESSDSNSSLKNKTERSKLVFEGYLIGGVESFSEFYSKDSISSTQHFLRRAKAGLTYTFDDNWKAELELVAREKKGAIVFDVGDAFFEYKNFSLGHLDLGTLSIGHMREPFGFERLTGLSKIHTNERSLTSSAFAPGRNSGAKFSKNKKRSTWSWGLFQSDEFDNPVYSLTTRYTYTPIIDEYNILHLGLSFSYRDLNNTNFRVKERGGLFAADNIIRSEKSFRKQDQLTGLELYWQLGPLSITTEYMTQSIQQLSGSSNHYTSYYLQTNYFVTKDYSIYKKGKLKSIKPNSNIGALEIVARYNNTNLTHNGLGSDADIMELGINYYYKSSIIIKLAFYKASSNQQTNTRFAFNNGEAISLRFILK